MQNKMREIVLDMIKKGNVNGMDNREAQYISFIMTTTALCENLIEITDERDVAVELLEFVKFIEHTLKEDFGYEIKMS